MGMKKKVKFSEAALVDSMQEALAHAQGKLELKTTNLPSRAEREKKSPARPKLPRKR
jgi:hypothetical protein